MADMELEPLIARAEAEALSDEPLARVAAARELCRELNVLGDEVVDHFVLEARRAGCSWAQIGSVLGVTRQGAQQRYGLQRRMPLLTHRGRSSPVARFGPDARRAVVEAQAAARAMGHGAVDTRTSCSASSRRGRMPPGQLRSGARPQRGAIEAEIAAAVGRDTTTTRATSRSRPAPRKRWSLAPRGTGPREPADRVEHLALALLRDRRSLQRGCSPAATSITGVSSRRCSSGAGPEGPDEPTRARPAP
jgi:hypothetical protein